MNKNLKIILFISVLLNVVAISFIAGQATGDKFPRHERFKDRKERFIATLPPEKRALAKENFKKMEANRKKYSALIEEEMKKAEKLLGEEKFDKEAFRESLTQANKISFGMKETSADSFVEFLATLNPEERKAMSKRFGQDRKKFRHHRSRGQEDFGRPPFHDRPDRRHDGEASEPSDSEEK